MTDLIWAKRGFDLLRAKYPDAAVNISNNNAWLSVDFLIDQEIRKFAIRKNTGCVYEVDDFGAAAADPILIPEGSPYTDHTPVT